MSAISISNARSIALFHIASKSSFAIGDSQTLPFLGSQIQEDPVVIYDLLGKPLFYDFLFHKDDRPVGRVRTSAETDLGSTVYGIEPIEDFPNLTEMGERADKKLAETEHPEGISSHLLVCYGYPKLGIRIRYRAHGEEMTAIYDIFEDRIVDSFQGELPDIPEAGVELEDDREGILVHSILTDELPEAGVDEKTSRAEQDKENLICLAGEILPESGTVSDLEFTGEDYARLEEHFGAQPPAIRASILPINVIGQKTPVYCAIASAKMILDYYGFEFTQDQIAEAMNVGPKGTTNRDQISGYKQLSNNQLVPQYDRTPTFEESMQMIESLAPMKSGVPGHARVCRGWKKFLYFSPITAEVLREELWLLVNDPYPVGQGSARWENINNHNYRNFIYLNRVQ